MTYAGTRVRHLCARGGTFYLGYVDIRVMPACKWRLSALPVLTYQNVRCAPVLESHPFRLGL